MLWCPEPDMVPPPCSVLMAAENLTAPDPRSLAWAPGEEGPFLLTLCRHQNPHFPWCFLPLPFRGTWPVSPGPAFLPCQVGEAGDFLCQLKTRFRYPSCRGVNTLQIIGSCTTYQLVIKLLPGPAEEIAAGWPSSA